MTGQDGTKRQLTRDEVLALKARAFDLLMLSIPCVRNPTGDEDTLDRAMRILDLPVPPPESEATE